MLCMRSKIKNENKLRINGYDDGDDVDASSKKKNGKKEKK